MGDSTFIQNQLLPSDTNGLYLVLSDSTYIGGTLVDGTYTGGQYVIRNFNPVDISYSIWKTFDGSSIDGCSLRVPYSPETGYFYANMYAPSEPGPYEIRWIYQKDASSSITEITESFQVQSWGIDT